MACESHLIFHILIIKVKPIPKPRKSLQRPTSASRQAGSRRPASAPRERGSSGNLCNDTNDADSDLDSIEQVERQNLTPDTFVPSKSQKTSKKTRVRPQSASKYESLKRVDHLQSKSLEIDQNGGHRKVRFDEKTLRHTDTSAMRRKKYRQTTRPHDFLSSSQNSYTYRDYHSQPLKEKYEELHKLYSKEYFEGRSRDRDQPEVMNFATGMLRKYRVKVIDPDSPEERVKATDSLHKTNPDDNTTTTHTSSSAG